MTARDVTEAVNRSIMRGGSRGDHLRLVRQFLVAAERVGDLRALIIAEPGSTGDRKWDALIAGAVEDLAFRHNIGAPSWTMTAHRFLEEPWYVLDFAAGSNRAVQYETPPALSNRGVYIRMSSLVSA